MDYSLKIRKSYYFQYPLNIKLCIPTCEYKCIKKIKYEILKNNIIVLDTEYHISISIFANEKIYEIWNLTHYLKI